MNDRRSTGERPKGISRRGFVRAGAVGGVAAAAVRGGLVRPQTSAARETLAAPCAGADAGSWSLPAFEFEEATISELQAKMASGELTARALAEAYLERIEALDRSGPKLNQVLEINPDALSIADALDREREAKGARGAMHGIPVVLKDNIDTGDRMTTAAGSLALAGTSAARDSFVAGRLRAAGAVLLGKTNLSEWANFRSTHSSSGWSGRGGQGLNPYALDRSPCGSSSGSGAATSANFATVAVGTETDGSVVCPSSANSLVGIKPTLGLVSRAGIIPLAHSQDTAGAMARTVTDAAILLGAMAGADPRDPATAASRGKAHADYTRFLDPDGLRGARIGVPREKFFGYSEKTDRIAEEALEVLKAHDAVLVDPADIPHAGEYGDAEFEVLLYEFKADLNRYLAARGPDVEVRSLADVIEFNRVNRAREMPFFGQEIMEQAVEKGPLTEKAYKKALETCRRLSRREGIDAVMDKHHLDALVAPTGSPPWTIDLVNGDHFLGDSSTPAAVSGYASITVPAGYSFGLPVGMSFFGRAYSEPTLLKLAYAFEHATNARRPPRFLTSRELFQR